MEKPLDPKNKPPDPDKNATLDNKKDRDYYKDELNRNALDTSEESNYLNVTLQKSLIYEKEDQPAEDPVSVVIELDALIKNYDSKNEPLQFHIGNTLYEYKKSKNINEYQVKPLQIAQIPLMTMRTVFEAKNKPLIIDIPKSPEKINMDTENPPQKHEIVLLSRENEKRANKKRETLLKNRNKKKADVMRDDQQIEMQAIMQVVSSTNTFSKVIRNKQIEEENDKNIQKHPPKTVLELKEEGQKIIEEITTQARAKARGIISKQMKPFPQKYYKKCT
ncbi:hypothetical protein JTB14_010286 [Gonioctena quinquepunctata]|nr:hypothetical protein JTB14_010286 [Gonioctena quinquepunctata]